MGLIALAGLLTCALVFLLVVTPLVWLILNVAFAANRKVARLVLIPTLFLCIPLAWYAFNAKEIHQTSIMASISKDCGWTEYKSVTGVTKVFLESDGDSRLYNRGNIESWYPTGEVGVRTVRYGIQSKYELVTSTIVRTTRTFMDFEKDEVIAKNIAYTYAPSDHSAGVREMFFLFLFPYYPSGECGIDEGINRRNFNHTLQPEKIGLK